MTEILESCVSFLDVKTETTLLKFAESEHIKIKAFPGACTFIIILLVMARWSFWRLATNDLRHSQLSVM